MADRAAGPTAETQDLLPESPQEVRESPDSGILKHLVGTWIIDQYHVLRPLATGGMGAVYLAEQPSMARHAAIKFLVTHGKDAADLYRRFRREARAISRLSHPHIVTVFNFGSLPDSTLFLAMEYVPGRNLREILREGPVPVRRVVDLISQCCSALRYAHSAGVVHRDFKPENVVVADLMGNDHAKVLDFGVARVAEESSSTETGVIVGTLQYMSPEQCSGAEVTPQSDQYALGVVFYELLVGRAPFVSTTPVGYIHMHQKAVPIPPSHLRREPGLEALDPIVLRLLAKSPADRYPSLADFQNALDELDSGGGLDGAAAPARKSAPPRAAAAAPAPLKATSPERRLREAATARLLVGVVGGELALDEPARAAVAQHGIHVMEGGAAAAAAAGQIRYVDVWPLSTLAWQKAPRSGPEAPPPDALVYIDGEFDGSRNAEAFRRFDNVLVGPGPLEAAGLTTAIHCMRDRGGVALENLVGAASVRSMELHDYGLKPRYLEELQTLLEEDGVRRAARWALRDLADELITNALIHAGTEIDESLASSVALHTSRTSQPPPTGRATLRWAIGDSFVALALRDDVGALTAYEISKSFARPSTHLGVRQDRLGAGIGFRVMARAARHVVVNLSFGDFCEVVALVDGTPRSDADDRRTLAVVQEAPATHRSIGQRLLLSLFAHGRALALAGEIDESCELDRVFRRPGTTWVDLSGVTALGSRGIQAWMLASSGRSPDAKFIFVGCSPAMVRQLNLMPGLADGGSILSLNLPYFCAHCKAETMELVKTTEVLGLVEPVRNCSVCCLPMSLDGTVRDYLGFLFEDEAT